MEWKKVIGFEGLYIVSDTGIVMSIDRVVNSKPGIVRIAKGRTLRPGLTKDGYKQVALSKDGRSYSMKVHRLVAIAFLGDMGNTMQVNHINGCKVNNNISNLEWVTSRQNIQHAFNIGIRKVLYGEAAPRSKKVLNTLTGEIFGSANIAAKHLGITGDNLRGKLNGKNGVNSNKTSFVYLNK